jgi:hypothetical protein
VAETGPRGYRVSWRVCSWPWANDGHRVRKLTQGDASGTELTTRRRDFCSYWAGRDILPAYLTTFIHGRSRSACRLWYALR